MFRLLKEWFAGKPPAGIAEFIARTPEIFVEAHESGRLTSKDFRRLYLYLLAQIDSSDAGQIENVGRVIVLNPSLQAMLEERAKVFLTSQRYEQNARWVYMQFVEGGYLAVDQGDCESFLAEAG